MASFGPRTPGGTVADGAGRKDMPGTIYLMMLPTPFPVGAVIGLMALAVGGQQPAQPE
jgi:hypothetical protein